MIPELALCCTACGEAVSAEDDFCEACGTRVGAGPERDRYEIDAGMVAGASHLGLVHSRNEDALYVASLAEDRAVLVVCDGVSSATAPHVAAQVAARVAGEELTHAVRAHLTDAGVAPAWDPRAATVAAIAAAHDAVVDIPWTSSTADAPSCTIVTALWDGDLLTVGWIGDSRAYWVGSDEALLLTVDHSWAQEQVDAGLMTEQAAQGDRRAHAITRWLGADAPEAAAPVAQRRADGPGWLVLCSDGLWNYAPDPGDVAALVETSPAGARPIEVARALVREALRRGGHDNVTVGVSAFSPARAWTDPEGRQP